MGDDENRNEWSNPPGGGFLSLPTRRRTLTSLPRDTHRKEWPLMRNFSTFIHRKGTKALASATGTAPQMSFKSKAKSKIIPKINARIEAEERVADLEKEIAEVKRSAGEEISELELKVASRDAVLRRRAVHMAENADKIAALEQELASAIAREADMTAESAIKEKQHRMREEELENQLIVEEISWSAKEKQWKKMEKHWKIREEEVEKIISDNRPRPVRGMVKSLVLAGTGAAVSAVAIASSATS